MRWQHPQYGLLPPGLFLDFVEAQGRMPDLTGFVFHAALDGAAALEGAGQGLAGLDQRGAGDGDVQRVLRRTCAPASGIRA